MSWDEQIKNLSHYWPSYWPLYIRHPNIFSAPSTSTASWIVYCAHAPTTSAAATRRRVSMLSGARRRQPTPTSTSGVRVCVNLGRLINLFYHWISLSISRIGS
jgi:hypothetical protein